MKIEISAKEVLEFINGEDVPALKEKLSGALLAAVFALMFWALDKSADECKARGGEGSFTNLVWL